MCGACFGRLHADIATLVGAHTWLGIAMCNPTPAFKAGTIHRSGGPGIPFRAELHDTRVDVAGKLASWARMIAEDGPPLAGPADGEVATVGRWLAARLPWVSDQLWCDAMAHELADAARGARRLVPWDSIGRELALPCPDCGYVTLTVYSGTDVIWCRWPECGRTMGWAEYEREVEKRLEESGHVVKPSTSTGAAA